MYKKILRDPSTYLHNTLNYYKNNFNFLWNPIIKKNTAKSIKNTSKTRKILMLKLDNGVKIPVKITYMKGNIKCFKINDIDINKIRVSEKNIMHTNIMCFMSMIMNICR